MNTHGRLSIKYGCNRGEYESRKGGRKREGNYFSIFSGINYFALTRISKFLNTQIILLHFYLILKQKLVEFI